MKFKNIRHDLRIAGHGFVEAARKAGALGKDDPGASGEFDVPAEAVEGLVHQAYGDAPNFEPVDAEAKKAVADAQNPPDPTPEAAPVPVPVVTPAPVVPVAEGTN